ncbi:glycoside hydrolase [Chryseolinea lacunae]|uniref:Xylanase n=1 Tax=Chryseolinea lacunae TaxID=2801331 RepID=A0ABS1KK25_9BACT|nr:glycoside hydrolase [Chryseolinea lacunae]MBL0739801.1 xylanase [Chryseolinea lacunae]
MKNVLQMRFKNLFLLLAIVAGGCSKSESDQSVVGAEATVITIDVSDRKQTIRNFGSSDAWACNFLGTWPDEKRNQMADWLFSNAVDAEGKPLGIGLSLWRFNIGGGSAAQDNIGDEWRRAEGFLQSDKSYDWSKQAGQQWFLKSAKQRGVNLFVGFTNSPPVQLTKNGKAFSSDGEHANIGKENYVPYVKFLSNVVKHFEKEGIVLNYLSPFNEPQWDWTGSNQEGTPYTNQEVYDITTKLDSVITADHLPSKIQIAEAAAMNYLYENGDKPTRGNQIEDFFLQSSSRYLGGLPSVDKMISAHSYFTSAPVDVMIKVRETVQQKMKTASVPLEFWQTEYCILGDKEEVPGPGKDTGMVPALYVARLIHHDLTVANASAWHWWTSISVYDYKDGLIYADKNKANGNIEDTKLLWAFGNYSRFVRPGAVRVGVSSSTGDVSNPKGLMVSSYINEADKTVVTVIINYADLDTSIKLALKGKQIASLQPYITAGKADEDLKPLAKVSGDEAIIIPRKSIVTLVSELP